MSNIYCSSCGTKHAQGSKFCTNCGVSLGGFANISKPILQNPLQSRSISRKKKTKLDEQYQYMHTKDDVINVPNSKSSLRHLFDEPMYECNDYDENQVEMHILKRNDIPKGPKSNTSLRSLQTRSEFK